MESIQLFKGSGAVPVEGCLAVDSAAPFSLTARTL